MAFKAETNMAIDEMLLDGLDQTDWDGCLRFYDWQPPAVSFGYAQKVDPDLVRSIQARGIDTVRRATGGRAVLHQGELTYSFIGRSKNTEKTTGYLLPSVNAAYRQICEPLLRGLQALKVQCSLGSSEAKYRSLADCFEASTQADLQYQGKKLVGSAQLRRNDGVLQHGSIMLDQSQTLMPELLGLPKVHDAPARHANLKDIGDFDRATIADAITLAFAQVFEADLVLHPLDDGEMDRVKELIETKKYEV